MKKKSEMSKIRAQKVVDMLDWNMYKICSLKRKVDRKVQFDKVHKKLEV